MKIRLDRNTCIGMFQCVDEWGEGFEEDQDAGKVDLLDAEEIEEGIFEREVPDDAELDAKFAARACPVDAIAIYEDGEQLV
ncbi:MAG: ferredoxin [Halanaeroarchaeum sp.]